VRESGVYAEPRGTKRALELVVMRSSEVIGVRHLLAGARAWIGAANESLVRISMDAYGGAPLVLGEVTSTDFLIHVPPRARARTHGADGIGRLAMGPETIALGDGDKTVVVLGNLRVRAQVVTIETTPQTGVVPVGALRWTAFVGVLYVGALALCAWFSPHAPPMLTRGAFQRAMDAMVTAHPIPGAE
jgi:hypothetical protein